MYKLDELQYDYDALKRSISEEVMYLHHTKHHQGYVDKLNQATEGLSRDTNLDQLLREIDQLPEDIRTSVRNNGGGHYNHSMFWQVMSPDGGGQPRGELGQAIDRRYQDFQGFVNQFSGSAAGLFGSGWVWLMPNLDIVTTQNQDNPIMKGEAAPILGLDVWEHAYYLDYKNKRVDYIKSWWDVVNWADVEKRYHSAIIS